MSVTYSSFSLRHHSVAGIVGLAHVAVDPRPAIFALAGRPFARSSVPSIGQGAAQGLSAVIAAESRWTVAFPVELVAFAELVALEGRELAVEARWALRRPRTAESEGSRCSNEGIRGAVDFVAVGLPCRLYSREQRKQAKQRQPCHRCRLGGEDETSSSQRLTGGSGRLYDGIKTAYRPEAGFRSCWEQRECWLKGRELLCLAPAVGRFWGAASWTTQDGRTAGENTEILNAAGARPYAKYTRQA